MPPCQTCAAVSADFCSGNIWPKLSLISACCVHSTEQVASSHQQCITTVAWILSLEQCGTELCCP
jgi:hypothetical protein